MIRRLAIRMGRAAGLAAILGCALHAAAWGWGGETHHYIAQHYSQHLPPYLDGLMQWDMFVDYHVTDPDARRSSTPGEGYKHYIDIDDYPGFLSGTLSHDRDTLEAEYGAETVLDRGVVPWAIGDAVATLTERFRVQDWDSAALMIADLCHYVGDASQPLHCTYNYDGLATGNTGIHSRYESDMMSLHLGELTASRVPAVPPARPLDVVFDLVTAAWADVTPLLRADVDARAASGGRYDDVYYAALWSATQGFTRARIDSASILTAALVHAAWLDAGHPAVPGSSASYPESVHIAARLDVGPSPFRDVLSVSFSGPGFLDVDVYDLRGARVARLAAGTFAGGRASWRPGAGGPDVPPGLYFVRLHGWKLDLVRRVTFLD